MDSYLSTARRVIAQEAEGLAALKASLDGDLGAPFTAHTWYPKCAPLNYRKEALKHGD